MSEAALQLWGVGKRFGVFRKREALTDVSIRVGRGECYGLAGPNGAGKTTLIRILLGLCAPDAGEVRLFGQRPDNPEVRRRVGFVPEAAELPAFATPRELVRRFARLKRLDCEQSGLEQLDRLGMAELLDRPAQKLSKGERQRTLLALALMGAPDLLVLDEPSDGLDPLGRALVRRVLREERAEGRTVFLNSHLLSETERICSRVGILHRGRLVREEVMGEAPREEAGTSALVLDRAVPGFREAPALEGHRTEASGTTVLVEHATLQELNDALEKVRRTGALIVEIRRMRADLEASFEAAVTASAPAAPADKGPAPEEPARVRESVLRPLRAACVVAREIAAELSSRRIGWIALAVAALLLGAFLWGLRSNLAEGAATMVQRFGGPGGLDNDAIVARWVGRWTASLAYWFLLAGTLIFSVFFAPPLLDPRRTILVLSQPIGRGDLAAGIWTAVSGLALAVHAFLIALLFGGLRSLGIAVSAKMLLLPLATGLAFASMYAVVLGAAYVLRNALFGLAVAIASLIALAVLGDRQLEQVGLATVASGLLPQVTALGRQATRLGGGESVSLAPFGMTVAVVLALILVLQTLAKRSER